VRARERARADRLIDDPWAADLAGEEGAAWLAEHPEETTVPIVIRTRFFDEFLGRAVEEARQVVLLAAGLDTRGFRLDWPPETSVFELDQPAVLEHKNAVLLAAGVTPRCRREAVAADLTGPWRERLIAAGFDPQLPSVWLLEGFLFYLPIASITRIIDTVTSLAARGSRMGFDIINSVMLTSQWTRPWVEMQARSGAPWIGTMDDPVGFLDPRGWRADLTQAGAEDADYGRWALPVVPVTAPESPHNWFVLAERTA
jgi:methyltransferase (TIGR00027 family)